MTYAPNKRDNSKNHKLYGRICGAGRGVPTHSSPELQNAGSSTPLRFAPDDTKLKPNRISENSGVIFSP
jgi:hypothetical protein